MASVKRVFGFGCAGILLLMVILVAVVIGFSRSLEESTWPARLEGVQVIPSTPLLAEQDVRDDNAYFYLRQITNRVAWTSAHPDEWRRFVECGWGTGDFPGLEHSAGELTEELALLQQAAVAPNAQVATADSIDSVQPFIGPVLRLLKAQTYLAERSAASGEWEESRRYITGIFRNAARVGKGGTLLNYLVTLSGARLGTTSARRIAEQFHPPAAWLQGVQFDLTRFEQEADSFAEAMRFEYLFSRSALEMVFGNPDGLGSVTGSDTELGPAVRSSLRLLGSSPKKTGAHFEAVYSHLIAQAEDREEAKNFDHTFIQFLEENRYQAMLNDPIGHLLVILLIPSLEKAGERGHQTYQEITATRVVLALRHWQADHGGQAPPDLEALVPAYLDVIPIDQLDPGRGPMRYQSTGESWSIYSVGVDGKDDGAQFNALNEQHAHDHADELDLVIHHDEAARRCHRYREIQAGLSSTAPGDEQSAPSAGQK